MAQKIYEITIDTMQNLVQNKENQITFTQNDYKTAVLRVNLTHENEPLDLTGHTVRWGVLKPDNTRVYQDATVIDAVNGVVEVVVNSQALAAAGKTRSEFEVKETSTGAVIVTDDFTFFVRGSVLGDEGLESANDLPIIRQLETDLPEINSKIGDLSSDLDGVNAQLAETATDIGNIKSSVGVSIEDFPRIEPEANDTARIQRAYDSLGTTGGYIRFPAGTFTFNLDILKQNVKLVGMGRNATFFKPADLTKPLIKIGDGTADVKYTTIEKVKLLGADATPPTDKPNSDGIVIDGAFYVSLNEIEIIYFGGDNLRITSTSVSRGTAYVFCNDFISQWAYGSAVKVNKGNAYVTAVYINEFSIQGYTNTGAKAIHLYNTRLFLSNGWITCKNGVGHIYLDGNLPPTIFANNVSVDSNSMSDTLIETTMNNATSARKLGTFLNGIITIGGKWKRGDGVVSTFNYEGGTFTNSQSKLTSAHVVDRMYFSNLNSTNPDDVSSAGEFYRDGALLRYFFDKGNHSGGLYLSTWVPTPPAAPTSYGIPGYWSFDTNYLYVCTAANTWKKSKLSTDSKLGNITLPADASTVVVNHGLSAAPTNVQVTPQGDVGNWWVSGITATQFTINVKTPLTYAIVVSWRADV